MQFTALWLFNSVLMLFDCVSDAPKLWFFYVRHIVALQTWQSNGTRAYTIFQPFMFRIHYFFGDLDAKNCNQ